MQPERVDEMLRNYREYAGRCKHLESLIPILQTEIEKMKAHAAEELVSKGGKEMDGMPHGTNVGNPTERMGIMLADGYQSEHLIERQAELDEAQKEYNDKLPTVVFVEAWLKGLPERERWVIENQVIDSVTWREIMSQYPIRFGETRTKRGLQILRDRAMEKIYELAS